MSRIIVSGSIAYDRIMDFNGLFAEHFIPDKLHSINISFMVDKSSVEFGGTAGNIAYNLALLGEKPEIISTAGTDFSSYRSHLRLSGIDPMNVRVLDGELTSSAIILTDKADNQISAFHTGAGKFAYDTPVETDGRALAIVAPGNVQDMTALPSYYKRKGFRYLYDPGQQIPQLSADALREGMSGADVLFASDYEYTLLQQKIGWNEEEILARVPTIVITFGAEGSRVVGRNDDIRIEAARATEAPDPTGAGDAYRAGFIKGILAGLSTETCGKLGSVMASYAIELYGTQTHKPSLKEIAARYKKSYGDSLIIADDKT